MDEGSGIRANLFGRTTAPRVGKVLGARMTGSGTNEAVWQGKPVTIKCAGFGNPLVGVTRNVLDRVSSVLAAFQKKDGGFDVFELSTIRFRASMREGSKNPTVQMVSKSAFVAGGTLVKAGLKLPDARPLTAIIQQLEAMANSHPIGNLQDLRQEIKGLQRRASLTTFNSMVIDEEWAFHKGGRSELQFNLGIEGHDDEALLRHGVAFSIEASRSYPMDKLLPILATKVLRFNDFVKLHADDFLDFQMWHFDLKNGVRSENYPVGPIPPNRFVPETFIILGKLQSLGSANLDLILNDLDGLLALYRFVEGEEPQEREEEGKQAGFQFVSTSRPKAESTTATLSQCLIDVDLRHNRLQERLKSELEKIHGTEKVKVEVPCDPGNRIDIVVRGPEGYWFYEIKTATTSRLCIREAIGQLLEYAYWPDNPGATRMVVAGEAPLDAPGKAYLERMTREFRLPLEYLSLPALSE